MTRRQFNDVLRWIVNVVFWPMGWLDEHVGEWAALLWAVAVVSAVPVAITVCIMR